MEVSHKKCLWNNIHCKVNTSYLVYLYLMTIFKLYDVKQQKSYYFSCLHGLRYHFSSPYHHMFQTKYGLTVWLQVGNQIWVLVVDKIENLLLRKLKNGFPFCTCHMSHPARSAPRVIRAASALGHCATQNPTLLRLVSLHYIIPTSNHGEHYLNFYLYVRYSVLIF